MPSTHDAALHNRPMGRRHKKKSGVTCRPFTLPKRPAPTPGPAPCPYGPPAPPGCSARGCRRCPRPTAYRATAPIVAARWKCSAGARWGSFFKLNPNAVQRNAASLCAGWLARASLTASRAAPVQTRRTSCHACVHIFVRARLRSARNRASHARRPRAIARATRWQAALRPGPFWRETMFAFARALRVTNFCARRGSSMGASTTLTKQANVARAPLARNNNGCSIARQRRARAGSICVCVSARRDSRMALVNVETEHPLVTSSRPSSRTEPRWTRREGHTLHWVHYPCLSRNARWQMHPRPSPMDIKPLTNFKGFCSVSRRYQAVSRGA